MNIIKHGDINKRATGEFRFKCKNCGCEWVADRGDNGLGFSPPCVEFYAYMKCPECKAFTKDR